VRLTGRANHHAAVDGEPTAVLASTNTSGV
jgi:hypothetical protein